MFTEEEESLLLWDIINKIIDNADTKHYNQFSDLDQEDLNRLSILQKAIPNTYSLAKGKIEDWILKAD